MASESGRTDSLSKSFDREPSPVHGIVAPPIGLEKRRRTSVRLHKIFSRTDEIEHLFPSSEGIAICGSCRQIIASAGERETLSQQKCESRSSVRRREEVDLKFEAEVRRGRDANYQHFGDGRRTNEGWPNSRAVVGVPHR